MNWVRQTISTTGTQTPISMDWRIAPFIANTALIVPAGVTVSATVEYTFDDVNDPSVVPVWIADATYGTVSATKERVYTAPYQFVRVNVASISGGDVYFEYLQGTNIN